MENAVSFSRLQEEQLKAISETDGQIIKLEKFKDDYSVLHDRLMTLPDKITHDVMVPFGKLAFMPGQLVHTNEITVLLGDNWFVDRSAKQAAEIVSRRIAAIDEQVRDLEKQKNLLQPRFDFTSELQDISQEIGEEYNDETEKAWKAKHAENMRNYKASLRENDKELSTTSDDYMAQLDKLELQERRQKLTKTVHWSDERTSENDDDDDDVTEDESDDSDDDDSEDDNSDEVPVLPSCIHFKHSAVSTRFSDNTTEIPSHTGNGDSDVSNTVNINSPADIYRQFLKPKSILKAESECSRFDAPETKGSQRNIVQIDHPDAVSDTIVEHNATVTPIPPAMTDEPQKRISKFKAQRLAKR